MGRFKGKGEVYTTDILTPSPLDGDVIFLSSV